MANPIKIKWLSDDADAVRGNKAVKDSLKDVADGADDVGDDITKAFRDAAREAGWSGEKIEDALDEVARTADDTADDVVRSQRRMADQSKEVGQEVRQNLGEGIANAARGDFESLADTIGDTLGGAVAGIGGIATAAVGAAGAVGLGALVAAFQLAEQERQKLEERASDLAQAYIDAGTTVLDTVTIAARTSEILTNPESRKEAEALRDALGVDLQTAVRALAGDTNALAVANGIVKDSEEEYRELMQKRGSDYKNLSAAEVERADQLQQQVDKVRELNGVTSDASETFKTQQAVLVGLINDAASATKEVDELGNQLFTLPDGRQIMIDADTGQATTDVSNFKGDVDGIPEVVTTVVKVSADTTSARSALAQFQRDASRGIRVPVGLGRLWE